ncbi:hypothetical protein LOZ57_002240 [Ophidiomyces ophidiicola]|uniref:uncharacterized protein n=1 Tax=Ophidiomyces ophidiicola TaxID=1387563 RepID=UPI0020C44A7D|nr:uncharacterized protein LOZ57_002240 [Ophidiomyces ophidiicola]KAI1949763.1 hypothetical protein LOZ57_002240 [Ophidiomyces ophidiicola]KAI2046620.1 hypothetical protein LOZ43_005826 [Ophidiomyces ophidiicola]
MKTVGESRQRWDALFKYNKLNSLEELKQELRSKIHGNPCEDGLRSICWKAFLLHKSLDQTSWPTQLSDTRAAYTSLRDHFLKYIEHPDDLPSTVDPLAEDDNSPWQSLRQDESIRTEIYQDVERCHQENYFFREPTTKQRLLDILFIFVKLNPDLGYRQGMHELLAPILWVIWHDAIEKSSLPKSDSKNDDAILLQTLDSDYIEHDAFAIFCAIMQTAKLFYEHDGMGSASGTRAISSIISRSQHIQQDMLGAVDPELASYLESIDILPQIYLTRWLRLFFGREFSFEDMLSVWDLLCSEAFRPTFIELVCVAMLLRIRWHLLSSDYSSALGLLLKYPSPDPHSPESFVKDALFLEENMTLDGGDLLILKYSGKSPENKRRNSLPRIFRATSQKRNSPYRDASSRSSDKSPSSKSPLSLGHLDSLFQDMSDGIYRRTEGWSVTKAVRGAMTEARRNIHVIQSSPSTPRLSTEEPPTPSTRDSMTARELSSKLVALEGRNRRLAGILGDAISDLHAHTKSQGPPAPDPSKDIERIFEKLESVQKLLQDSSQPMPEKLLLTNRLKRSSLSAPKSLPPKDSRAPQESRKNATETSASSAASTANDPADLVKPTLTRPILRAPLAESSFSWMLGEGERRSAFAPCASVPPEHLRKHEPRTRPAMLFGDQRSDDKYKRTEEVEKDVLVLDRLQGSSKE